MTFRYIYVARVPKYVSPVVSSKRASQRNTERMRYQTLKLLWLISEPKNDQQKDTTASSSASIKSVK